MDSLPKNLTHLGYRVFNDCQSISELTIPKSLKMLPSLSSSTLPNLRLKFEEDSQLEIIAERALSCLESQTVYLPASVRYVEQYGLYTTATVMLPVEFCNADIALNGLGSDGTRLYMGTKEQAGGLTGVAYYSEGAPEFEFDYKTGDYTIDNYWHYDENGNPVLWE